MSEDLVDLSAAFSRTMKRLRAELLGSAEDGERSGDGARLAAASFRGDLAAARIHDLQSTERRTAFWINIYNACASLSLVELGIRGTILLRADFFIRTAIEVGGLGFSLDAIEHGVLRGNRHPRAWPLRPFGRTDPRRELALPAPDPRLSFALNKGAASSPALRIFAAGDLEDELNDAELAFALKHFHADPERRAILCSRLYDWSRTDIGERWLGDPAYRGWKVSHEVFDWRAAPG